MCDQYFSTEKTVKIYFSDPKVELTNEWKKVSDKHIDDNRFDYYLTHYAKINTKTNEELSKLKVEEKYDCPLCCNKVDHLIRYDSSENIQENEGWSYDYKYNDWFVCLEKNAEIRREQRDTWDQMI